MHTLTLARLQILLCAVVGSANCVKFQSCDDVNGKNLSLMSGDWEVRTSNNSKTYHINFCGEIENPSQCRGSAICVEDRSNAVTYTILGSQSNPPEIVTAASVSFYLEYNTTVDCEGGKYSSSVTFECGKTLGSPVILYSHHCRVDLLWESYLVCAHTTTDPEKSVRCYDYDSAGSKHDLDSIIKRIGAYKVTDPSATPSGYEHAGLYINICQDITVAPGDSDSAMLSHCPGHSAACLVVDETTTFSVGLPTDPVKMKDNDKLVLTYAAEPTVTKPSTCSDFTPKVTVTFICPGRNRGGSRLTLLTSSANCQYEVEWWTEAACPIDFLSSSSCGLNYQQHGLDIDLTPLKKTSGAYNVKSSDSVFWLNVCGVTHLPCGTGDQSGDETAVCQTGQGDSHHICGKQEEYSVQYVDEVLSLSYKNGDRCSHGFRRNTLILFHCNATAGVGSPVFSHEVHCTYYFDWDTSYACVASSSTCHLVDDKGLSYDLSPLTRITGGTALANWEVLTGYTTGEERYYINVCSELMTSDTTTTRCPAGSAVCMLSKDKALSYGSYQNSSLTKGPNNNLQLDYHDGSDCTNGKKKYTSIAMYCSPGVLESSPVLKYTPSDCALELTWHTAAACPLKTVTGDNCVVSDEESGLTFDLSRLSKADGEDMYKITNNGHDYFINVCKPVTGTTCAATAGACQVEQGGEHRSWVLGETSEHLMYYDGFIKLIYENGALYSDKVHHRSVQISFLCDPKAGAGTPTFESESNYTYVFNWYTAYVCPLASTQCMVTDPKTGDQYDLSLLGRSEDDPDANWSVMDEDEAKQRRKYYLNVCRPVNEVWGHEPSVVHSDEKGCDPFAGACQTQFDGTGAEHVSISSLGSPTTGPVIEQKGRLVLDYVNGSKCSDTQLYSTRIHFVCAKGQLSSSPRFLQTENCVVSFIWETESACAIKRDNSESKPCEVSDPNSEFVFDLQPLQRKPDHPYIVDGEKGYIYELNVCGKVDHCGDGSQKTYGGCRKDASGTTFDKRVDNSSTPTYSDDGVLTLYYNSDVTSSDGRMLRYVISFICSRNDTAQHPRFSRIESPQVHFDFPTPLACQPHAVDCLVTDDFGNQYDLTPLVKSTAWSAISSDQKSRFFLSVCQPLPQTEGCPVGPIGACRLGQGEGTNLGIVQSNPTAVNRAGTGSESQSSTVSIVYSSGDRCKQDPSRRYSTRILFFCSIEVGLAPTYYEENTDPCEFVFMWRTPVACKTEKVVTGLNCAVEEPLYHMTFDLSPLKQTTDYHVAADGEWSYDLNVCQKLQEAKGKCADSAACQIKADDMHEAGKLNTTLVYEDGVVTLSYLHGQKCHQEQFERSSTIRFTCDHGDVTKDTLPTFINEESDCTYMFDWPTPHVCPPIRIVACTATDSTLKNYDLSPLSLSHTNFEMSTLGDTSGRSYYINVCRNLLHKKGVTCPPNSAACVKLKDGKYKNLGRVTSAPMFSEDGHLQLKYTDGDVCRGTETYTSTVRFVCDPDAAVETTPVVLTNEDNCHVMVEWTTKAACAIKTDQAASDGTCTARNDVSGHTFNLASLKSTTYYDVMDESGRIFHINVCGAVKDDRCPDDAAVCIIQNDTGFSAGSVSKELRYADGALVLTYSGGDLCKEGSNKRHASVLSFICHRSSDPFLSRPKNPPQEASKPVYIGENKESCIHYFSWHVYEACEVQTPCAVTDSSSTYPRIIDLSALVSESGHTTAVSDAGGDRTVYFLNICRSLEPIPGYLCPPGSAACKVADGQKAQGIGFMTQDVAPVFEADTKSVSLTYPTRIPCTNAGYENYNVSTKVIISCLPGSEKGIPRLTAVTDDCTYLFEWASSVVCSETDTGNTGGGSTSPPATGNECTYADSLKGITYDFSKLTPLELKYKDSSSLTLTICGHLTDVEPPCVGTSVCLRKEGQPAVSLGKTHRFEPSPTNNYALKAIFTGDECPDGSGTATATVLFECTREKILSNFNEAWMLRDSRNSCSYLVYWPTPYACPPLEESCTVTDPTEGTTYDLSLLSSISHSYELRESSGTNYLLNLCRPIHTLQPIPGCDDASVCMKNADNKNGVAIGLLQSQSMRMVDSGDDGRVIEVRYSGGVSTLCGNNKLATTTIQLSCGKSVRTFPQFDRFDKDKCIHYIKWKTRIACADKDVTISNMTSDGKFEDPKTGLKIDLSRLFGKSWIAEGDLRNDGSYNYLISFLGNPDLSTTTATQHRCGKTTSVCQYNPTSKFERVVGENKTTKYSMSDESLEVTFESSDRCGKDSSKHSHSTISLRCWHSSGIGKPRFVYESNECGYFFDWYTREMCVDLNISPAAKPLTTSGTSTIISVGDSVNAVSSEQHRRAVTGVVVAFVGLLSISLLALIFHKQERRSAFASGCRRWYWSCCGGPGKSRYRYYRVGEGEEDNSLVEEDLREESSLLNGNIRNSGGVDPVSVRPIDLAGIEDNNEGENLFDLPEVRVSGSKSKKRSQGKSKPSAATTRSSGDGMVEEGSSRSRKKKKNSTTNPFEDGEDSEDLLGFIDKKSSETKGKSQGRRAKASKADKVKHYHDDDDDDLLEG